MHIKLAWQGYLASVSTTLFSMLSSNLDDVLGTLKRHRALGNHVVLLELIVSISTSMQTVLRTSSDTERNTL